MLLSHSKCGNYGNWLLFWSEKNFVKATFLKDKLWRHSVEKYYKTRSRILRKNQHFSVKSTFFTEKLNSRIFWAWSCWKVALRRKFSVKSTCSWKTLLSIDLTKKKNCVSVNFLFFHCVSPSHNFRNSLSKFLLKNFVKTTFSPY